MAQDPSPGPSVSGIFCSCHHRNRCRRIYRQSAFPLDCPCSCCNIGTCPSGRGHHNGSCPGRAVNPPALRLVPLFHKTAGVFFAGIVVSTFFPGLQVTASHGEPVLATPHGLLGLADAVLCTVQMGLSLFVSQRHTIRKFHRIVGYLIVPLFLLQILLGLNAAGWLGPDSE
jgi:hypothetical protein